MLFYATYGYNPLAGVGDSIRDFVVFETYCKKRIKWMGSLFDKELYRVSFCLYN